MFRRALAKVERPADFVDRPALVVAKRESGPLDCRQIIERFVHQAIDFGTLGQTVGPGPFDLGQRCRLVEDFSFGLEAMAAGAHHVHRTVGRDPVQPGAEVRPCLKPSELAIRTEKAFLHDILGILFISHHAEGKLEHLPAVLLDECPEGLFVSLTRSNERGRPIAGVHLGA
jgi:hypothetical protein